jgi:hypothetical protein
MIFEAIHLKFLELLLSMGMVRVVVDLVRIWLFEFVNAVLKASALIRHLV